MKFDLHLHSYYSDGRISPRDLVGEAKKIGLEVISLTDHESVGGIAEAIQAGNEFGVKVIPGIEIAVTDHDGKEQHLLGLFIDYKSQELKDFLAKWEITKFRQIQEIVMRLQKKGFRIEFADVVKQSRGSLNRPQAAYTVFGDKENMPLLEHFGVKTPSEFFKKFLNDDSPETVFLERKHPGVKEVIELIKRIQGIAIWAHSFWKEQTAEEIEQKCLVFQQFGLDGIEVCYARVFSKYEMVLALHRMAEDLGLYETGGSDFHSFEMFRFNKLADFDTFGLELNLPPGLVGNTWNA